MVAQMVKSVPMPTMSLGQEDPLEKEMATHSNILAWKIPWEDVSHLSTSTSRGVFP